MRQTVLSVVLDIQPQSVGPARALIEGWRQAEESTPEMYSRLKALAPSLHFMSITVFPDCHYDPILVIEANFDGPAGPLWAQMEAGYGPLLRDIVRCCKRPADDTGLLFDAVTAAGSRRPVAAYLEAKTLQPMIFHQGNRGLDRSRILDEAALFLETRRVLAGTDQPNPYAGTTPQQVHATLRAAVLGAFPWLDQPAAPRIGRAERVRDLLGLAGFLILLVFCLSIPGLVLAAFASPGRLLLGIVVVAALAAGQVYRMRAAFAGQAAPRESGGLSPSSRHPKTSLANTQTLGLTVVASLALYVFAVSWVLAIPVWALAAGSFGAAWRACAVALALGLASLLATVPLLLVWLRWLERRDATHDDPTISADNLAAMARLEDQVAQNHMGSVVLVKPGILRMALVRTGLWGLGRIVRVVATDGYLGSMRTIHFAHWAMVNNGARLLFFSNFDGSWESYLDDFIEKAHGGLSLAWGNCTGFPPGRFLVMDGASHGRRFKAWARHSMAPSLFWFSAYPRDTVNQIERQALLADGLRRPTLSPEEAAPMDQDAVARRKKTAPSWTVAADVAVAAQGIIVSGFNHLRWAEALFLRQAEPGGAWLEVLDGLAPVTDATGKTRRAATLAFTWTGLRALGLDPAVLATFADPFQQGMHQPDRSRRLGDADGRTLVPGGMRWSGNAHDEPKTRQEVHALLLLYDDDPDDVRQWADQVAAALAPGVVTEHRLALDLMLDDRGLAREHFGFTDGLSQPVPYGDAVVLTDGQPVPKDKWHGVASGDVMLGHVNAHHEPSPGPYVADGPAAQAAGLVRGNAPDGFADLGLNGSYMVVRELQQDVAAFWTALDRGAAAIQARDPSATHVTPGWLAERIVGRNLDGALLCPGGYVTARDGEPGNGVGFIHNDPHGHGCPMGSHVRRANPRDGLAKDAADAQTLLDAANNHRILRRGRKFGPPAADPRQDDGQARGLLFICLNTDLVRQFEFVQQTWMLNPNFATLYDETDPLVGPCGPFTVHDEPLRRIIEVDTFVKMAGGDYFFLPSMPALRYLRALP